MNSYVLFGKYDVLAQNMEKMARESGKPERHIVYRRMTPEDKQYAAIATIDAMPNGNMMLCFAEGMKEGSWQWQAVTKKMLPGGNIHLMRQVFRGDNADIDAWMQNLCDWIELTR